MLMRRTHVTNKHEEQTPVVPIGRTRMSNRH